MTVEYRRQLSPLRNTTLAEDSEALALEQAEHFGIDPKSEFGIALITLAKDLYQANQARHVHNKRIQPYRAALQRSATIGE